MSHAATVEAAATDDGANVIGLRIPFYCPLDPIAPKIWPNYSLVMPVCAVGNVGQLACDLIIATLLSKQDCQLIGRLYSPALMPVVGPNAYNLGGPPSSSTEVYESKRHKLIIIQQRTSYFKPLKQLYVGELVDWIKASQFDQVLVLTSSFAQCNPDTSQLGDQLANPIQAITTSQFETAQPGWQELALRVIPDKRHLKVVQDGLTYLPGSGLTKPLIKACERAFVRAAFLVDFCSEGVNIPDSYQLASIVDRLLNLGCGREGANQKEMGDGAKQQQQLAGWVEPFSWREAA